MCERKEGAKEMALKEEIEKIVHSAHQDPFEILGAHVIKWAGKECVAVRAFLPDAAGVAVVDLRIGPGISHEEASQGWVF